MSEKTELSCVIINVCSFCQIIARTQGLGKKGQVFFSSSEQFCILSDFHKQTNEGKENTAAQQNTDWL